MNAQLELRFELIRAITPKYSEYKYIKSQAFEKLTKDTLPITKAIKKASKPAKTWTRIDVDVVATGGRFTRGDAVRKLQEWNDIGAIELHTSGVVNRFRVLRPFPQGQKAKDQLVTSIYAHIEAREKSDMARVRQVIDLVTHPGCSSRELARHFGDEDTVPTDGCRHCNFCLSNTPVKFLQARDNLSRKGRIDEKKIKAILAATNVRDDARFLARVAFGISSPRVTTEKLGKHGVFGSMDDCDFEVSWYFRLIFFLPVYDMLLRVRCLNERGGSGLVLGSLMLMICFCVQELVARFEIACGS